MHQAIYRELKQLAKSEKITCYSSIAPLAGLDMTNPAHRREIGEILGEISQHEHDAGRPLLSAVVISRDTNMPGEGFFKLARDLSLFMAEDELSFFTKELEKVYAQWR